MENNAVLKSLRFTFQYNDTKMVQIFALADHKVGKEKVRAWLSPLEHKFHEEISDTELAIFLNAFIIEKRGKKDGPQPEPEKHVNNNIVLKKLKIALALRSDDMLEIFRLAKKPISAHELGDILRNPKQKKYKPCGDQYMRNFMHGLQIKYRDHEGVKEKLNNSPIFKKLKIKKVGGE